MKKLWLSIGLLLGLSLAVTAQTIGTFNLNGSEVILGQQGGPGGTGLFIPSYVLRGGESHTLAATGTTVTTQIPATSSMALATGAITTWNVNLPTAPFSGQRVIINCPGGTVSTLTITATLPASVAIVGTNPTSCTSGGTIAQGVGFTYSVTANTWYRYI